MQKNIKYFLQKLTGKLWFRPLIFCLLSIAAALLAHLADNSFLSDIAPDIEKSMLADLLNTMSASMLVIAIFAVGSMLSAFSAASGTATPRSFKLIVADDVSQNALSVYIGSFIFSIVSSVALKNGYYGDAGYFTLFVLTLIVFAIVIFTFLRWVERISKLGRLGHTIKKVEGATRKVLIDRIENPYMGGRPAINTTSTGTPLYGEQIGYIQHINMDKLQKALESDNVSIVLNCLPGTFTSPDRPLAYLVTTDNKALNLKYSKLVESFIIDDERSFHDDPRFGLIALSEIASRALSPGINDPGTAIAIIGSHVRLFSLWVRTPKPTDISIEYDKIMVPALSLADMFDDAFRPIARDGASNLEVMIRFQKALISIAGIGSSEVKEVALSHSQQAYERSESAMEYKRDLTLLKSECLFTKSEKAPSA
jgi:uncharacterized membrane protein